MTALLDAPAAALPSDDDLMIYVHGGEPDRIEASLALLECRYRGRITGLVQGIVRDRHLAEDVTQEVFAKIFLKSHLYRLGTNFQAWLFEVARNQALSALRNRRRTPAPIGAIQADNDDGSSDSTLERLQGAYEDRDVEEKELMSAFDRAVADLPEPYRGPFDLCVRQGLPYKTAARQLGIPTGTVAIRIMRARQRLFQSLCVHVERVRRPPACLQ